MEKMPKFLLIVIISCFCVLFSFCSNKGETPIKIGVLTSLSGENATYGQATQRGLDLALEDLKVSEEFKDIKFNLIYEDTRLEQNLAVSGIQKLTSINKVPIILGPFGSSEVKAVADIANSSKTPIISASATDDKIADLGDYIFRTVPSNKEQGNSMADFVFSKLNIKDDIIILSLNNDYGASLSESFKNRMTELGGKVIYEDKFETDANDFKTLIAKVKGLNPKFVFIPDHYNEAGIFLKQAKELGLSCPFGGGDGSYSPQLIEIAGAGAENFYLTLMGIDNSNPVTQKFVEKYKAKYDTDIDVYSAYAYDALFVIAQTVRNLRLQNKEINAENMKNELYNVQYTGITGLDKFDSKGEVKKDFVIYQVRNGKFEVLNN